MNLERGFFYASLLGTGVFAGILLAPSLNDYIPPYLIPAVVIVAVLFSVLAHSSKADGEDK